MLLPPAFPLGGLLPSLLALTMVLAGCGPSAGDRLAYAGISSERYVRQADGRRGFAVALAGADGTLRKPVRGRGDFLLLSGRVRVGEGAATVRVVGETSRRTYATARVEADRALARELVDLSDAADEDVAIEVALAGFTGDVDLRYVHAERVLHDTRQNLFTPPPR